MNNAATAAGEDEVLYDVREGIARLVFNRPGPQRAHLRHV